jgi:phosphoribosylformylglycinamidine cyclo-ligase
MERGTGLPQGVAEGDVALGLASDGVHANGFSLVRRVVEEAGLDWDDPAPFGALSLGEELLTPTRLYSASVLPAIRAGGVRAVAHITGGGLTENVPRILPEGLACEIDLSAWALPPVFGWLAEAGALSTPEMLRTFNAGIGMVVIVAPDRAEALGTLLMEKGERVIPLGRIAAGTGVRFRGEAD